MAVSKTFSEEILKLNSNKNLMQLELFTNIA